MYSCWSEEGCNGSSHCEDCDSSAEMPDCSWSKEREIWPSLELGSRFRDMARWRSSRESLMWSASRNNCDALVVAILLTSCRDCGCRTNRDGGVLVLANGKSPVKSG